MQAAKLAMQDEDNGIPPSGAPRRAADDADAGAAGGEPPDNGKGGQVKSDRAEAGATPYYLRNFRTAVFAIRGQPLMTGAFDDANDRLACLLVASLQSKDSQPLNFLNTSAVSGSTSS